MTTTFTFKTTKPTGRYASFNNSYTEIKQDGKYVGTISAEQPHRARFMVTKADVNEDGKPNCPWMWITLKHEAESVKEQQTWLKGNYEAITKRYTLHQE